MSVPSLHRASTDSDNICDKITNHTCILLQHLLLYHVGLYISSIVINQVSTLKSAFEPAIDCNDGDILLYDGTTLSTEHSNGTVLTCLDNEYGTVCDDFWDVLDAMVVCGVLGFESAGI